MNVDEYVRSECDRQHSTLYPEMARALESAKVSRIGFDIGSASGFGHFVCHIAHKVEPDVNTYHAGTNHANLRTSHVGFMDGGSAAPAGEVRERFDRWCEFAYEWLRDWGPMVEGLQPPYEIDSLIKQLLDIHPWADGNGRTASILRNWMLNKLDDPEPLPYFYGNV